MSPLASWSFDNIPPYVNLQTADLGRLPKEETALGVADAEALAADETAKAKLRANTDAAIGMGVWGVPTFAVGMELVWGADRFGMLLDYIEHPSLFEGPEMRR